LLGADVFFDLIQGADIIQGLIGQSSGIVFLAAVLFPDLDHVKKLAAHMGPTAQMDDALVFGQVIITIVVIALDVALIAVQKIKGSGTAAGGLITIQHRRMGRIAAAKHPHV